MLKRSVLIVLSGLVISACSLNTGRYHQSQDSAPGRLPTAAELQNAVPVQEPYSNQGNSDYQVLGQSYQVLASAKGFTERGLASWYGNKFHGHLTSNGEYYDMYSMTAAHKQLPLPSYVRVTNLANQKTVVVRVNDRGPFHPDRVIDLSFAAAYKLDMLDDGTAPVKIEAINLVNRANDPAFYIQLVASSDDRQINRVSRQLAKKWQDHATTVKNSGLYKLLLGPFPQAQANRHLQQLRGAGFPRAFRVKSMQNDGSATDSFAEQ